MDLMRIVSTHPQVVQWMEQAARKNEWAMFRIRMSSIGVDVGFLSDPMAVVCTLNQKTPRVYAAFMICMPVGDGGTPWRVNLSARSDVRRVGQHSVSWCFSRDAHKEMVKEGFNVDALSEET